MGLKDRLKLRTDLPDKGPAAKPFNWQKLLGWLFFIGLAGLLFYVPHPTIFYYSTIATMVLVMVALLIGTLVLVIPLAELKPGQTSYRDRIVTLFRLISLNRSSLLMVLIVLGMIFGWAATGIPWVVEQVIGPYVCPPGYNEMIFKTSTRRLPISGYAIAFSFEGYCSGTLGIFRGIRLLHFFIALMGAYWVLVALCLLAVLIVRLIQPRVMIESKTIGPILRPALVVMISLALWAELLLLPKQAPAVPQTISRLFNLFNHYSTELHAEARQGDIDDIVMALEAYPGNVNRTDNSNYTPLALAIMYNNLAAADMLRRYDATVSTRFKSLDVNRVRAHRGLYLNSRILEDIGCEVCMKELAKRKRRGGDGQ